MSINQQPIVSIAEVVAAAGPIYDRFCDPTYAPTLGRTVMKAVDGGREEAFFAPVVKLAIDIALAACMQEEVFERLPAEVSERAQVAQDVAFLVGRLGTQSGQFLKVYQADEFLREGLRERRGLKNDLENVKYLPSQCEAPFREVGRVAGGAFHALRRRGVNKGQSDIIARSRSLPLVATIPKEYAKGVYDELGRPYLWPRHYIVGRADGKTTVELAPKTIKYLQANTLPLRGCPAASLYPYGTELSSLLREGWEDIVYYLLLPDAQVSMR